MAAVAFLTLASSADAAPRGPLDHEGRWITDKRGRVVILHGWNMVYKVGSYRPEDTGFGSNDMRFLRRHGFNTIRLGLIQKGVEPNLPRSDGKADYRDGYLRSIARTESKLARHGIFTLLDV
ncbi:MAG: endoglycoceramidase, partial [Actinomycetota bacterium]|nr:endoglycoceramidase [Actinomycetota bacterium]